MFASSLTTPPTHEPFTVSEVKDHLRIEEDVVEEDAYLASLVRAARVWTEGYTNRSLINQTWETRFNCFANEMFLPRFPLQSVTAVKYLDSTGSETTVATSVYDVDTFTAPGRITLGYSQTWPTPRVVTHAVRVTYVAGYGTSGSDIPEDIRHAMLLLIGAWHENREPIIVGASATALPAPVSVPALLSPYIMMVP